jgi:glutamate:GABA antiporter
VKQETIGLVRALRLRDLVLFNLVAVLGLRHISFAAQFGPSSLVIWIVAALLFFIPQGLVVIELSSRFPRSGGLYFWTKDALGEGHGFLCGWCYWTSAVLFYPNLLLSTAGIATYVVGEGGSGLKDNWLYVIPATLIALWIAVILNLVGVGTGKWLQDLGGLGTYIPGALLILLGIYAVATVPSAQVLNTSRLMPHLSDFASINFLATIAFAFAGLELISTMGDEIENPSKNLPRAVYIAAPMIAAAYILGTGSVLWLVPEGKVDLVTGFLDAIGSGAGNISGRLVWLAPLCAMLFTLGSVGGVGAWLSGPARIAFAIGLDRYFPPAFGRIHPKWKTPYVAILTQAILATLALFISVLGKGTTVQHAYLILLDTTVLLTFIPYIYIFVVFLVHRMRERELPQGILLAPGGRIGGFVVGMSGLLTSIFAMIVAMIPPPGTVDPHSFRLKVIGGATAFVLLGCAIYLRGRHRQPSLTQTS